MGWKLVENEDGTKVWTEILEDEEEGDEMEVDVQKKEDVVLQLLCMTDQSTINVCAGPSGKTEVNILNTLYFVSDHPASAVASIAEVFYYSIM
jgi:polyribonucleotide nucleotidyltransferase